MSFADHLEGLDTAVAEHLCELAIVRPVSGAADILDVPAFVETPTDTAEFVGGDSRLTRSRPEAQVLVSAAPDLVQGDILIVLGVGWKLMEAPRRPGDGRWWIVEVNSLGPTL